MRWRSRVGVTCWGKPSATWKIVVELSSATTYTGDS